jgi:hypothetical protein
MLHPFSVKMIKFLIRQFFHPIATSHVLGPNILLSTVFSKAVSPCISIRMRTKVSRPYKTNITLHLHIKGASVLSKRENYNCR